MKDPALPGIAHPDPALEARLRAAAHAWQGQTPPRTRHLDESGQPRFINRLALEASPYLRQHAYNPVNWLPWGEEAFERARALDRPIFLSIGYSTCHWCHVMEEESFEDPQIARQLNEHFVAVKVDREERPDVDATYMAAVLALRGQGGWPMTLILTPDRKPIFAATYLPPRAGVRGARMGLFEILGHIAEDYEHHREKLLAQAEEITEHLVAQARSRPPAALPGPAAVRNTAARILLGEDPVHGGFGHAPKFPRPVTLDLLLRVHRRTGEARPLEAVLRTLRAMARGGIFDQLGGGFHRYSTDARWRVPHFEKMLYDNAQLAAVYTDAWQLTGEADLRATAEATLDYLLREMQDPEGGFYAATDADSLDASGKLEEGAFFTWTPDEVRAVLPEADAALALRAFGVTAAGDLDGRSVLHRPEDDTSLAAALGLTPAELQTRLGQIRTKLLAVRARRPTPLRDEKILVAWNGLTLSALARAALAFDRPDYLEAARRAADRLLRDTWVDGRLYHSLTGGERSGPAFLEDYAALALGLLDLHEVSGEMRYLEAALAITEGLEKGGFWDEASGGYFRTGRAHEVLLTREKPDDDGALPSGNALAAHLHLRLAVLLARPGERERADAILAFGARLIERAGIAAPHLVAALERRLDRSVEIVVVLPGGAEDARGKALVDVVRRTYLPNRALMLVPASEVAARTAHLPLLKGKHALHGHATAYVCHEGTCKLPTDDPKVLAGQLAEHEGLEDPDPAPASAP